MKRTVIVVIILALLGAFAFWWFGPTQVLKRRTQRFLSTLTLEPGSAVGGRKMGIYALNALLSAQIELTAPPSLDEANGIFDRSEIESAFSWLCDQAKQTRFTLGEFHSITIDGDQADVAFSLDALVELPNARPADGPYEVTFHWQKETDVWHLSRAKWVEARR